MKGKVLHIGAVVLGFIVMVPSVAAFGQTPEWEQKLAQIDANEVSQIYPEEVSQGGDEASHIRFSDVKRVTPAISVPSQQSMSSTLSSLEELTLEEQLVQRMNEQRREQRDQRNDRIRRNQDYQNGDEYRDQNRNERNQNDRQNREEDQDQDDTDYQDGTDMNQYGTCPDTQYERCFYSDSQQRRCELFGGTYRDGRCSIEDIDQDECEDMDGSYQNGRCELNNFSDRSGDRQRNQNGERQRCENQGGTYRNGECSIDGSGNNGQDDQSGERQRCENRGGTYQNGECIYDNRRSENDRNSDQDVRRRCEERGGQYSRGTCSIDRGETDEQNGDRQHNGDRSSFNASMISSASNIMMIARTEARKACEEEGGEYIGNQKCVIDYDQRRCEKKDGSYRNDECIIDTDNL